MKQITTVLLVLALLLTSMFPAYASDIGDGNLDGGGGNMGQGTSDNFWNTGDEGVRVTVVRASDHAIVHYTH